MLRYYLSPVIGSSTPEDPRRPLLADIGGVNWVAVDDRLGIGMMLVAVNAPEADHARLRGDAQLWAFPVQFAPDNEHRNAPGRDNDLAHVLGELLKPIARDAIIRDAGPVLNIDLGWLDIARHRAADVLRAVGRAIDPAFNERNFWVSS